MPSACSTTYARQLEGGMVLCLDLLPPRVFLCTRGFAVLINARDDRAFGAVKQSRGRNPQYGKPLLASRS